MGPGQWVLVKMGCTSWHLRTWIFFFFRNLDVVYIKRIRTYLEMVLMIT
jgi:hypothetical protein